MKNSDNSKPAILFIESNTSGTGAIFLQTAFKLGYHPVLFSAAAERYNFANKNIVKIIKCDTSSIDALLQTAKTLIPEFAIQAIWSSSEYYIAMSAKLAELLQLPALDAATITRCRDKEYQRQTTRSFDPEAPRSIRCTTTEAATTAAQIIDLPVIIKPIYGSGSIGVKLCQTLDEVSVGASAILDEPILSRFKTGLLIEDYVEGVEYSAELFDGQCVGITRKHVSSLPFFVEIGHDFPVLDQNSAVLMAFAEQIAETLGLNWGPSHIEVKLKNGQPSRPVLIEANPRLAGGYIPTLVQYASGIDLIEATLRRALGQQVTLSPTRKIGAAIRFILRTKDRAAISSKEIAHFSKQPQVVDACLYPHKTNDPTQSVYGDFRDRIGHVIAIGKDLNAAVFAINSALNSTINNRHDFA